MDKTVVYLSGGITKNANYKRDFRRAAKKMRAAGFQPINPVELISTIPLKSHDDYMDISFAWLDKADAIYMICGWSTSEGAVMEYERAFSKGIPILYEDGAERNR